MALKRAVEVLGYHDRNGHERFRIRFRGLADDMLTVYAYNVFHMIQICRWAMDGDLAQIFAHEHSKVIHNGRIVLNLDEYYKETEESHE